MPKSFKWLFISKKNEIPSILLFRRWRLIINFSSNSEPLSNSTAYEKIICCYPLSLIFKLKKRNRFYLINLKIKNKFDLKSDTRLKCLELVGLALKENVQISLTQFECLYKVKYQIN